MRWCLAILCFSINLSAAATPDTIRALVACDATPKLRYSTTLDFEEMQLFLRSVAADVKVPLSMRALTRNGVSTQNILNWLKELPSVSNDVIIVYYSGHGARFSGMKSPWPCLAFVQKEEILPIDTILKILAKKQHRLVILLFDCCNSRPRVRPPQAVTSKALWTQSPLSLEGIRKLFLHTKGAIIAVAASPGQPALALKEGGLFTNAFLHSIKKESAQKEASWNSVLRGTIVRCQKAQKPIISVRNHPRLLLSPKAKHDRVDHVILHEG